MSHPCSKCEESKVIESFGKRGNICRECRNSKRRDQYKTNTEYIKNNDTDYKICSTCNENKQIENFYKKDSCVCRDCNNLRRREKYKNDEEHRKKLINVASEFKHKKVLENQQKRQEEQLKIGIDNKECEYCHEIKNKVRFRHNRLKCKDCERDHPIEKFKRVIRSRIHSCLKSKNNSKNKHSVEYLGCSSSEYSKWLFNYNPDYNLENHGKVWHIDHVIPLSTFDLESEPQQLIAFNWRNTMPLSVKDNLAKNRKIIKEQVEQHYKTLEKYHLENNLDLPQVFIDLFAKHLDDGKFLKPSLPLTFGNIREELG